MASSTWFNAIFIAPRLTKVPARSCELSGSFLSAESQDAIPPVGLLPTLAIRKQSWASVLPTTITTAFAGALRQIRVAQAASRSLIDIFNSIFSTKKDVLQKFYTVMLDLTTWRNGNKTKPQPKRLVVGQQLPYHGQQSRWSEREG